MIRRERCAGIAVIGSLIRRVQDESDFPAVAERRRIARNASAEVKSREIPLADGLDA